MGVSVFHGGFSTLLAISVLSFCQYYIFVGLYKCWIFIISFGLLNGLILLPVTLSLIGPISDASRGRTDYQQRESLGDKPSREGANAGEKPIPDIAQG